MKKAMRIVVVVFLFLGISSPTYADDVFGVYRQCLKKNVFGSFPGVLRCVDEEQERIDKILNDSYNKIMKSELSKKDKEEVKKMQLTWLSYRKQFNELLLKYLPKVHMSDHIVAASMIEILKVQTEQFQELQKYITKEEGYK